MTTMTETSRNVSAGTRENSTNIISPRNKFDSRLKLTAIGAPAAGAFIGAVDDDGVKVIAQNILHHNTDQYGYTTDTIMGSDGIIHHTGNIFGYNGIHFAPWNSEIFINGKVVNTTHIENFPWPTGHNELTLLQQFGAEGAAILALVGLAAFGIFAARTLRRS